MKFLEDMSFDQLVGEKRKVLKKMRRLEDEGAYDEADELQDSLDNIEEEMLNRRGTSKY